MNTCSQPGCSGTIADGYCDVCGMAPSPTAPVAGTSGATGATGTTAASARRSTVTNRLGMVPLGSARSASGSRPTRRLGASRSSSRLGAGLTHVAAVPIRDPLQALMDPPAVAEDKRFCSVCQSPVGRSRDGAPGRAKGFCPKCRTPFDFEPKLRAGTLLGGQYEIVGCLAHGGMGWIYLARDRNVNDRWVVVKGLLNAGDPDAFRAAVAEKQFLAEVEHPTIVEIYNFVSGPDGASYIIMEYVGGQALNSLLKSRMQAAGGVFSPLPLELALAYIIEALPAFSYLHALGLLYCDFKPANVIQVGDGIKLIDLGGVRRIDDDVTPIYGTVGFQAPEVPSDGTSVASDIYTIARTLAVLVFEFRGSQTTYVDSLPPAEDVELFADNDSLYRLLLRATAPKPADRFATVEELGVQMLGVLREVAARSASGLPTRSTPSVSFAAPRVATAQLEWGDLPQALPDGNDPSAAWLDTVTATDPAMRLSLLANPPEETSAVTVARAYASLALGDLEAVRRAAAQLSQADPWEWRAVWMQGLVALHTGAANDAVSAFNTVYGQLPGELAPKLALARACELAGDHDVADRAYLVCERTDAAYVAAALFGRARVAIADGRGSDALSALEAIPPTSRAFGESRRMRAELLATTPDPARVLGSLDDAARQLDDAAVDSTERARLELTIFDKALQHVVANPPTGPTGSASVGGTPADEASIRRRLELAYRAAASTETDRRRRVELVDLANRVRVHSLR